jgi:hypothetical protein
VLRPDLPAALDQIVLRALSRDRGRRFRDLEELARALGPFTSVRPGEPIDISLLPRAVRSIPPLSQHSEPGSIARPTPPISTRRRRTRAMLSGALVALALLGGVAYLSRREPEAAPLVEKARALAAPAAVVPKPVEEPIAAPTAPAPELAPEEPVAVETAKPDEPNVVLADKPAASSARLEKPRERKTSKVVRATKSAPPSVIPGERTNGLAADDF